MKKLPLLALLLAVCAPAPAGPQPDSTPAALQGDSARPAAAHWVRNELYFGVGPADRPDDVGDIRWQAFLDREVTPRFPDGLTVLDGYGQWKSRGAARPEGLHTKVLIILCEDTPQNRAAVDAIRSAYKKATRDQSVLLATNPVDISF